MLAVGIDAAEPTLVRALIKRAELPRLGALLEDGVWVHLEVAGGKGKCRLRVKLSDATPPDVVNTGMGWWLPSDPSPSHGALDCRP